MFRAPPLSVLSRTLKALSDPGRLTILFALRGGPRCVCELRQLLGLAQPTVSKHLKILENAGLVEGEKRGQWVHYRLAQHPEGPAGENARALLAAVLAWMAACPEAPAIDAALETALAAATSAGECPPCAPPPVNKP